MWDCLFHEYSLFPVHFSRLYQRHLSKEKRPLLWTSRKYPTYRGRVFSQQFLTMHMRTERKREKLVSNRTDSSVSVDERQIKESRGGWQRSLPLPDLSRKIEGPLLAGYLVKNAALKGLTNFCWLRQLYAFHPSVLLLTIKISRSARENSLSYCKNKDSSCVLEIKTALKFRMKR